MCRKKCHSPTSQAPASCRLRGNPIESPPVPAAELPLPREEPRSKLAVTAFALSLVPFCPNLVALGLGITVLAKLKAWRMRGRNLAIASIALSSLWLAITPFAVRNYRQFPVRSKQGEAKWILRSIHAAAKSFEKENSRLPSSFAELAFAPEATRRYAYFFNGDALQPDLGGPYGLPASSADHAEQMLAFAVANLDLDDQLDLWGINRDGELVLLFSDVTDREER